MNWRSKGAAVASHSYAPVPDSARLRQKQDGAIDLNAEFHRELRAKRRQPWNRGWGDDWIHCPHCAEYDLACPHCGGEGGWPASATRYDDGEE